ncbi:GvpL/GvpF family gas vesicle protein [Catenulispora subtropica]|uniref:GvpL/GvpF family gas vesicle protein n=1 Tax=Catenulispora subtropica TaxID=450798 RepID=A0ABN2RMK8_9ACTN
MTADHVWLYAVVSADGPPLPDTSGVAGESPYLVPGPGVAAVAGRVPRADFDEEPLRARLEDVAWLDRTVRTHHRVIAALATTRPVLPMRYATVYREDSGVSAMLSAHRDELLAILERITGCTEWGVKIYLAHASSALSDSDSVQPADEQRPGTAYLLRRKAQRWDRQETLRLAADEVGRFHGALAATAVERARHPLQDSETSGRREPMLLNGAYLVADEHLPTWEKMIASFVADHDELSVEVTGPWPAYSFTDLGGRPEET